MKEDDKLEPILSNKLNVYEGRTLGNRLKCWYCGNDGFTNADHFWPKSMRGRLKVRSCSRCNKIKKNLTPNGFIDYLQSLKLKSKSYYKHYYTDEQLDRMIRATSTLWERVKHTI